MHVGPSWTASAESLSSPRIVIPFHVFLVDLHPKMVNLLINHVRKGVNDVVAFVAPIDHLLHRDSLVFLVQLVHVAENLLCRSLEQHWLQSCRRFWHHGFQERLQVFSQLGI